jgi:hypothetical protein
MMALESNDERPRAIAMPHVARMLVLSGPFVLVSVFGVPPRLRRRSRVDSGRGGDGSRLPPRESA